MGLEEKVVAVRKAIGTGVGVTSLAVMGTAIAATGAAVIASFGAGAYIGYTGGPQGDYSVPQDGFGYMIGGGCILPAGLVVGGVIGGIAGIIMPGRVSGGGPQDGAAELMGGIALVMASPLIWGVEMVAYGAGLGVGLIAGNIA